MRFPLKATAIVALGFVSCVVTPMTVPRVKRLYAGQEQPPPKPEVVEQEAPAGQMTRRAHGPDIASTALHLVDATVAGDVVHLAAGGTIRDTRPEMKYVWGVRVLDQDDRSKILFERFYKDQVFGMPPELERSLTFEDVLKIPLARGTYLLDLAVYEVHPRLGLIGSEGARAPVARLKISLNP